MHAYHDVGQRRRYEAYRNVTTFCRGYEGREDERFW